MVIVPNEFVWIHNPKVAGTNVREQLLKQFPQAEDIRGFGNKGDLEVAFAHMPLEFLAEYLPESIQQIKKLFSFGFARNPYDRVLSAFNFQQRRAKNMPRQFTKYKNFSEFIEKQQEIKKAEDYISIPQYKYFSIQEEKMVDLVLKIEEFKGKVIELNHIRMDFTIITNTGDKQRKQLNKQEKALVEKYYAKDFELLGY